MMNIENSSVLITGGTGSWGQELTSRLLKDNPKKIIILSRGEIAQVAMERKFRNKKLQFVIGDVRDSDAMDRLFEKGIDYVFHLAALKHVPICENYPQEAIKTNIIGTTNVVNAAIRHGVKKFIDVSTDKAVSPTNLYGMTKSVGEKVSLQANCLTQDTAFICIRGGNVLGTNGSVVPYIIDQIKNMNKVEITDPGMTRFFLTLPQAIELLYKASLWGRGGETFVMRMPSFYIIYLVELLVNHYGNEDTQVNEIGMKEGEKIHEVLISEHECKRTHQIDDDYYVIYPQIDTGRTYNITLPKFPYVSFSSADNLKDINYLKNMLEAGGFLR